MRALELTPRAAWLAHAALTTALLGAFACGSNVIVTEGGGGAGFEGGAPSNGGALSTGGSAQGGGGSAPEPIPGCESLVWAGEPVVLPGLFHPRRARLAMLDGGRVGVVYDDYDNFGDLTDKVLSQTLSGAFDSWPPKVGPLVTHYAGMLWNAPWWLSARAEGVFAVSGGNMSGIFRFDDPTPIVVDPFLRTYLLEPEAGGGAYVVDHSTGAPPSLSHFSSVEPLAGETALGELELPDSCGILHASFSGGSPLFVFGPGCSDTTPAASFFALGPTGELAPTASFELPYFPIKQRLEPRPGGFDYALVEEVESVAAFPTDLSGAPEGPPFVEASTDGRWAHDLTPWRGGHAVAFRHPARVEMMGVSLTLFEGPHVTEGPILSIRLAGSRTEAPMVVEPHGTAVLVAFETIEGIQLLRADCVPATE
ncbi:MAG: hypothetical protein IPM79_15725 [Polyangiaceae bacterium]|nr:hypothetical protein [Polyangiaceae bacterium]MBK8939030.1 hypothetical protein [Polyangiaceae bacterium]